MRKIFQVFLAIYLITLLCSFNVDHSDPQKVILHYIEHVVKHDYKNLYELITTESKDNVSEKEFMDYLIGEDSTKNDKMTYSNLLQVECDPGILTYKRFKADFIQIHKQDTSRERIYFTLINEDGRWRICWVYSMNKKAAEWLKNGNYIEPKILAEKAIHINPYSSDALQIIGDCYYLDNSINKEERIQGMDKYFKMGLEVEPDQISNYSNLGHYYTYIKVFDTAVIYFTKALKYADTKKEESIIYHDISSCYLSNKEFEIGISYSKKALSLDSNNMQNWVNLGVAQIGGDEFEEACKTFEKALTFPRKYDYILLNLYDYYTYALMRTDNWTKAKECVLKGLEIDPSNHSLKNSYNQILMYGY